MSEHIKPRQLTAIELGLIKSAHKNAGGTIAEICRPLEGQKCTTILYRNVNELAAAKFLRIAPLPGKRTKVKITGKGREYLKRAGMWESKRAQGVGNNGSQ